MSGPPSDRPPAGDPAVTGIPGAVLPGAVLPDRVPPAAAQTAPEPADQQPRADRCRAERAERRQRRRISVGCALLVAVCLVITILIVGMARSHNPGAQVVVPGLALAAPPAFDSPPTIHAVHTTEVLGAKAPEGGNR